MLEFMRSETGRTGKALTRTLAAAVLLVVTGGTSAKASLIDSLVAATTNAPAEFAAINYSAVPTQTGGMWTPEKPSSTVLLPDGFDIQIGASVLERNGQEMAAFRFFNNSSGLSGGARIHEIYFESGLGNVLAPFTGENGGADYVYTQNSSTPTQDDFFWGVWNPVTPSEPNSITPDWDGTAFGLDKERPIWGQNGNKTPHNGLSNGDWYEIIFSLQADWEDQDIDGDGVVDVFAGGDLTAHLINNILHNDDFAGRIGMHIGECLPNVSCKIDTWPVTAIPLPAALPLYGTGLAIMGFVGWRKRRKAQAS